MEKVKKVVFTFTGEHRKVRYGEHYKGINGDSFSRWMGSETNEEYDICTREEIEEVWKPKDGDSYYLIANINCVKDTKFYSCSVFDEERVKIGNYFRTREAAEKKLEQIKKILAED